MNEWWKQIDRPYPVDPDENLRYRLKILAQIDNNPAQAHKWASIVKNDIETYFDLFLWTYDPRQKTKDMPFILYPFQRRVVKEVCDHIDAGKDLLIEKSRDMGVSWILSGVFFYRWHVHGQSFLVGSEKEEKVDKRGNINSLFEKMRYFIRMLPKSFKPRYNSAHMNLTKTDDNAVVQGESSTPDFGRAGRYNAVFIDELAHIDWNIGEAMWQACSQSSPCRITASSVKGCNNKFAQLRLENKIDVLTVHWREHPYKDDAWYQGLKSRMSALEIAQEIDINYIASAGKPFYSGFDRTLHVIDDYTPNIHIPIYIGVDYGYHRPAFVLAQHDGRDRLVVFNEFIGTDMTTVSFAEHLKGFLNTYYRNHRFAVFADPAGEYRSDKSEQTSREILENVLGVYVASRQSSYRERKELIEAKLNRIVEGKPALLVCKYCKTVIDGFAGGYRYPEPDRNGIVAETPFKDGYYDHVMNALEYIFVNIYDDIHEAGEINAGYTAVRPPDVVPIEI